MPYDYAVLDNGQGGGKKPRSAKVKYVRAYLKSKGMKPTRDAASRSPRERKLRAKARAEFAAMGKKKSSSSSGTKISGTTRTSVSSRRDTPLGGEARQAGADVSYAKARAAKAYKGRPGEARQAAADAKRKNKNYNPRYR